MAKNIRKKKNSVVFWMVIFNFVIICLAILYFIYLRFVPYTTIKYSGYAVSGKEISMQLFNSDSKVEQNIPAVKMCYLHF